MLRFNEAIDESLAESMSRFAMRADEFRNQFVGILSHDLRNPLGAIIAGAALLALPEDIPQRRSLIVTRIMTSAQRMERMIRDLLDVTRTRLGGSIPLNRRVADLRQLCEEAVVEVQTAQPEAVVRLEATGDLRGEWDGDRLSQLIGNLIANALQHGGGTPVALTVHGDDDAVTLAVVNGGRPIPSHVLPDVFEPLARGRDATPSDGIGLGLFIARAIVAAHGGDIQVSSSLDAGTTFTVTLPRS